jgi:hypothetical protein
MPVEAADDDERAADAEVAIEIDNAGDGEMRLVVARGPGEMRIAQQDRAPGLRPVRRQRPRVRSVFL